MQTLANERTANSVVKEKRHPSWELFNICVMAQIPVRISSFRISRPKRRGRNVNNLIPVSKVNNHININTYRTGQFKSPTRPSFGLINARSLLPKVDELTVLMDNSGMDIVAITESWLHKDIDDNLLSISGYNIHRNDRTLSRGGSVCVYCSQNIPCQRRFELKNPNFECIWLWIRPTRLPRSLSAIAVCVVYNPPPLAELLKNWLTSKNTSPIE